jgi:diguanylate cyclase (GGDEF)-like protein
VEPSPGRGEAESAAERRLHAVVDTLGLHVYSGETYPDDRFVTTVSLTPARSLLGLERDSARSDEQWLEAIHPDDRARYAELFCYANERLLHPLELEYRLCGYDGVQRWVWERIFPHRLRDDGVVDIDGVVADVTALHEATHERNDLSQRLERVLGGVAEFVVSGEIRDGRNVWVHRGPGIERMLGGPLPEGADGPTVWYECVHPDDRGAVDAYREQLARAAPADATYRLCGLDGVERWVWARARPHPGSDPIAYDAVISDVSERERARVGLQLAREEAERRSRVDPTTGLFNRHHLLDVARRELARAQREHTSPALVLLDVDRLRELNELRGHAVGDAVLRELAGRLSHSVRTYDTISHLGAGRFAVLVPDIRDGEALRRIRVDIAAAMVGEPLRSSGREVRMSVSAGVARAHPGTTVDALLHTAEVALARAKRAGADHVPEISDTRGEPADDESGEAARVAATLARAAAVREGVPYEHECSVAELAELVGRELGLGESLQADLRLAGLLHDVGTIAVAGAVLSKPGPLDEDEWVMLREHPSIGADMVARIPGLARTQLAIRHHHERFDGHGYPDRLAGEAIPVAARVLAAVDAYTAMTEIRPYRSARDRGEALEELRRNAGTQLDPAVVEALCRVLAGENAGAVAA